jgi:hypothetical protein
MKFVANYCGLITTQQLLIISRDKFQITAYKVTGICVLETGICLLNATTFS